MSQAHSAHPAGFGRSRRLGAVVENTVVHYVVAFVGVVFFVGGDLWTTWMAFSLPMGEEGNPFALALIEAGGFEALIAAKVVIVVGVLVADWYLFVHLDDFRNGTAFGTFAYYLSGIAPLAILLGWGVFATLNNLAVYWVVHLQTGVDPHGIAVALDAMSPVLMWVADVVGLVA